MLAFRNGVLATVNESYPDALSALPVTARSGHHTGMTGIGVIRQPARGDGARLLWSPGGHGAHERLGDDAVLAD